MSHLLLIDDDRTLIPTQVRAACPAPAYSVDIAVTASEGLAKVRAQAPDVVLLDIRLPDRSGLDVYEEIRAIDARIPVIFITMSTAADTAIEAMKRGAFNYLSKPLDLEQLRTTVVEALEVARRMRSPVLMTQDPGEAELDGALFGRCQAMMQVYKAIGRVAAQDVPVLITGESGTGKELVARAIYQHSGRAQAPFLALNCGAIPESLIESELFGHEKGAFTGADRRRIGKFEQCNGGTILLDEIGDMPLAAQTKMLRLLQSQTFERVGGNETIRTNVRIIAATHRDLRSLATAERFRSDLYYRLGVFSIELPALRDRGDDLSILVRHFVRRFSAELNREIRDVTPEAMDRLRAHSWPGNVRELQSVLKQALLGASGPALLPAFLPDFERVPKEGTPSSSPLPSDFDLKDLIRRSLSPTADDLYAKIHGEIDRVLFTMALDYTRGNHSNAARVLGISRQTMRMKLRALGLSVGHTVRSNGDTEEVSNRLEPGQAG